MTVTRELKLILLLGGAAFALMLAFLLFMAIRPAPSSSTAQPLAAPQAKTKQATQPKTRVVKPKVDRWVTAALAAGLPRKIARQFATHKVVVIELYSDRDTVDGVARQEAALGASSAGAGFVAVDVERNGAASTLTKLLGQLPPSPAALFYTRPGNLFFTLAGFHDRTTIEQAARNAGRGAARSTAG